MGKLSWGIVGGGEGSQIGPAHRYAAGLDGLYDLVAAAPDINPQKGKAFALSLGVSADRAYGDWQAMLAGETAREDRLDLVTIATPNNTHFEIAKAFLEAGFHVLCEKPITMTSDEAEAISELARRTGKICAVNYGYSGYPMVRQMREMVADGQLGAIRLVKAEFAHGFHADATDMDNPRVRWRYDPAQAGVSAQFADCGIHALHMACFVTGQVPSDLSADFASLVAGRELEDDALVNFNLNGGTRLRLWTSSVAAGQMHGLTLRVFGEKGGLRWSQEDAAHLYWTPLNGQTTILERGAPYLMPEAIRASRITIGHAEGMESAFANIYRDLADVIEGRRTFDHGVNGLIPNAADGLMSMRAIERSVESAKNGGRWMPLDG